MARMAQDVDLDHAELTGLARTMEGVGTRPMPKTGRVMFHDDFTDGRYHGWRHTHFGGDVPFNPLSVEQDYPFPGLFMATAPTPYRAGARAGTVSTYRGLSGRLPTTGIVSFSGLFAIQSGGPDAYSWSGWGLEMDIQNWSDTLRANPQFQCANPSDGSAPRWQVKKDDGSFTSIGAATAQPNPANPSFSGVSATRGLTAGENEGKWDVNYLRVSFDLGDLFTATALPTTARYYEININGYRFDLRGEGAGRSGRTPQAGNALASFRGGLNFGINLYRDTTASSKVFPARLVAGELTGTYHETGWLA